MQKVLEYIRKYPLSLLCIAAIWYLSLLFQPPETELNDVPLIDKWVHVLMYGGTCSVIWIEYLRQHNIVDWEKLGFWGWFMPIVMSGVLELMQAYGTTNRNGDWFDLLANSIGATLAIIVGLSFWFYKFRR